MKKEYDLKNMEKRPKRDADPEALKTSIHLRLDAVVVGDIKVKAVRLGIPYQTLINSILTQYCNGSLYSQEAVDVLTDFIHKQEKKIS